MILLLENVKWFAKHGLVLLFAAFSCTLASVSDGMHYGWQSPFVPKLMQPDSPIKMTNKNLVWLDAMYFLGAMVAVPLVSIQTNKQGRKRTLLTCAVVSAIAWYLIIVMKTVNDLFIARFIAGVGSVAVYGTGQIYIAEIADKRIRGFLSAFVVTNFTLGMIIIYSIGPYLDTSASAIVGLSVIILQFITFVTLPETPYYRLIKSQESAAERSLQFYRRRKDISDELNEIKECVTRQQSEPQRFIDLFTVDSNRKGIVIVSVLYMGMSFSGMSVIYMNLHTILEGTDELIDSKHSAIIFTVVLLIAGIFGSIIIDKIGRKMILSITCFFTSLSLSLISAYFFLKTDESEKSFAWIIIAAVLLYAFAFMSGFGIVVSVYLGELFPTSVKSQGANFGTMIFYIQSLLSLYFHRFLTEACGLQVSFLCYTLFGLATLIFTILYVPETAGLSLEEIQQLLKSN